MVMVKERRDVKPLMVKFGVALAICFAGFFYARIRNKRIKPPDCPPCTPSSSESSEIVDYGGRLWIKDDDHQLETDLVDPYEIPSIRVCADTLSRQASAAGDKDSYLLLEFDELVKDLSASTVINKGVPKAIYSVERDDYEHEIENLKRTIRYLRERERKLEVQLLEYYGLKEQEKAFMELQNRVKINNVEAKLFSMRIESLETENKRLSAQVVDYSKVVSELENTKAKIKLLKRKIRHDGQQNKEQILELTQRVTKLRDQEHVGCISDSNVNCGWHKMTDLETEVDQLRKSNEILQQENAELGRRLESTQFLANSLLDDLEKEELNKELLALRKENENLTEEAERLQSDRCADAEELVYLRWINACLRYELRNYQAPPGKTIARDLSKCLSPNSEKKAKHLILEYAKTEDGDHKDPTLVNFDFDTWSSSQPSSLTDSTEHKKELRFFARLMKLIKGKQGPHYHDKSDRVSPIYRSHSVDDLVRRGCSSESPQDSKSCFEGGTDESMKLGSSSQNSNRSSLGHLGEEYLKDVGNSNRLSDSRSSHGGFSSNNSTLNFRLENDSADEQKSQLAKYAEVLRVSRSLPRMHKKAASYSNCSE